MFGESPVRSAGDASFTGRLAGFAFAIAAGLVVLAGVALRLDQFGRDLSTAEAWVANSAVAPTLHEMLYYERWLQTTPPLLLFLVRYTVKLFGLSDYTLRAVPFAFSVLGLFLLVYLARRMLRPFAALICITLVALSPAAIVFSKELKQYSSDVTATCLVLLVLWKYSQHSDRRHFLWLLLAFVAVLPLSYTAVVFIPLALCVIVLAGPAGSPPGGRRLPVARVAALFFATGAICGLNYFLFIKPNTSPLLTKFWEPGYPPTKIGPEMVHFLVEHYMAMGVYFSFPLHSTFKDSMKSLILYLPIYLQVAAIVIALAVAVLLIKAVQKEPRHRWAALFFFVPLFTLMGLNWMRLYPVSSRRLTVFMLPCVALFTGACLEALWQTVLSPLFSKRLKQAMLVAATALWLAGLTHLEFRATQWDMDWAEDSGCESAMRFLKSQVRPDRDLIFVHASDEEPARLYFKMLRWDDAPVRYGHTGLPCCKRVVETRPADAADERAYVLRDFENAVGVRKGESVWLVSTDFAPQLPGVKLDEPELIADYLSESGCQLELVRQFGSTEIKKYDCTSVPNPKAIATVVTRHVHHN